MCYKYNVMCMCETTLGIYTRGDAKASTSNERFEMRQATPEVTARSLRSRRTCPVLDERRNDPPHHIQMDLLSLRYKEE